MSLPVCLLLWLNYFTYELNQKSQRIFTKKWQKQFLWLLYCFVLFFHFFFILKYFRFVFSMFWATNFLFDCAAETHLQQRHTWVQSAHLTVHINLILRLLLVWLTRVCRAVEISFCLCVLGVDQVRHWSSCFNCIFFMLLFLFFCSCMFVCQPQKKEKHTIKQCAIVNSLTGLPSWDFGTFNLNHTGTLSNHRASLILI